MARGRADQSAGERTIMSASKIELMRLAVRTRRGRPVADPAGWAGVEALPLWQHGSRRRVASKVRLVHVSKRMEWSCRLASICSNHV